jgi:hypothetical protein
MQPVSQTDSPGEQVGGVSARRERMAERPLIKGRGSSSMRRGEERAPRAREMRCWAWRGRGRMR